MFEVIKHSGPARLGLLKFGDSKLVTPNILDLKIKRRLMFHPGFDVPRDIAEFSVLECIKSNDFFILGSKYIDLRIKCAKNIKSDILAIGDGEKLLKRPKFLVKLIEKIRTTISPNVALYFPFASPHEFYLLAFLGVDLFDLSQAYVMGSKGIIQTLHGTLNLKELKELPCYCEVCRKHTPEDLLKDRKLAIKHNKFVSFYAVREIREAIRRNELRELVEEKASSDVNLMAMLRSISYNYEEKYSLVMP
ncbi:MAG: hypothetical protein DRN25_00310 [Thermoplasmata archaeon]|nr:MAG: hypothetical protein DRN25_00310 [Thermoplasmata archaeon]